MNSMEIPSWITEGPNDVEYRTYKLHSTISKIKDELANGNLIGSLSEIDKNLDYLYMYDAIKVTHEPDSINNIVGGFNIPGLEIFFTSDDMVDTNPILDSLLDEAIDAFERLHANCRERWRLIELEIRCSYVPSRPYFLNDGFVFIKTPDNMLHVYHFTKPSKYISKDWKTFNMTHMYDEKWTDETYFSRIEELISKESEKIIIRVDCTTETILENNMIAVIKQSILTMLNKDYSF